MDEPWFVASRLALAIPMLPRSSPRRSASSLSEPSERGIGCPPYLGYASRTQVRLRAKRTSNVGGTPSWMIGY